MVSKNRQSNSAFWNLLSKPVWVNEWSRYVRAADAPGAVPAARVAPCGPSRLAGPGSAAEPGPTPPPHGSVCLRPACLQSVLGHGAQIHLKEDCIHFRI